MIKVSKFGGSSVASSSQFKKVKDIILTDKTRKVVVTSAIGKINRVDNKITDLLYLLFAHVKYGVDYEPILSKIKERFYNIKNELNLSLDLDSEFNKIICNLKNSSEDYLVSRGEYLTSMLLAEYLGYKFIDSKDVIIFEYNGHLDYERTSTLIKEKCLENEKVVIPGFYGSYPNGDIKTFSRGGSDITGAIVAKAIDAIEYENFTDVSGILMADPKIVDNPKKIKEITYDELRELSYMGASIIHEETVLPIEDSNIPLHILNTNEPDNPGTIIKNKAFDTSQIITGIAGKKGFIAITIVKNKIADKLTIINDVLNILKRYHVTIEHIPTSIDSFSVIIDEKIINNKVYDIISEIKRNPDIISVQLDHDLALLAVVGRNMVLKPGISGKIFQILGKENINIKMIAQGTNEINIIVGVKSADFEKAIRTLYQNLIN